MLSSLTRHGAEITMRCLELGAVDFQAKPSGSVSEDLNSVRYALWKKIRDAARATVQAVSTPAPAPAPCAATAPTGQPASRLVAIGASTGGPRALQEILVRLPGDLPAGLLVVQHMPPHFTAAMAQRLDGLCALRVQEAVEGMRPEEGLVVVARGGQHLRLDGTGRVTLTDEPPVWAVRPAVDPMMADVAALPRIPRLGVILTGMGQDGALGLGAIKRAGGATLAQDEASCVVYGMPRAAVRAGVVDCQLPLSAMADAITLWCQTGRLPVTGEHT
jgi:two-component system chemotaxis response regulator CheB